ncbi:hypothetical protein D3C80_939100 [compost metagenome]
MCRLAIEVLGDGNWVYLDIVEAEIRAMVTAVAGIVTTDKFDSVGMFAGAELPAKDLPFRCGDSKLALEGDAIQLK